MAEETKNNKRKSNIKKTIVKKFNTAKYETLDIIVEQNHEIEWTSIDDLEKKSDNITKLLIKDFESTRDRVFKEMNMNGYNAFINEYGKKELTTEEKKEFDSL